MVQGQKLKAHSQVFNTLKIKLWQQRKKQLKKQLKK